MSSTTKLFYSIPVLDPNHLETQLSQSSLNLALTPARELCMVQKAGGLALDANEMLRYALCQLIGCQFISDIIQQTGRCCSPASKGVEYVC